MRHPASYGSKTRIETSNWYDNLCVLRRITQKLRVIYGCSTYWTTALLSEMFIFCVRVGCVIQLVSYGSKHASQSLYHKPFVRTVLQRITWKLQVIYGCSAYQMTVLLSETFLVWFRVAWEIRLESYGFRHSLVILWYNIVCVYHKPIHTSLFGVQLRMTTKLIYDCIPQTKLQLYCPRCIIL